MSRRRLGRPAPALLYQLTARGWQLDPVLTGPAQWGPCTWPDETILVTAEQLVARDGCVKTPASLFVLALQRAAAMETPTT